MSFEPRSDADLVRLIAEYPLAWVVSCNENAFRATPLPLIGETDTAGRVVALFGHFALANPHVELLRARPAATILFSGPNGYISPEAVSQRQWAPTWNYAVAQFNVEIELVPRQNDLALTRLVRKMEAGRRAPWNIAQLGARYAQLVPRIVAFRAHVRTTSARFKLGQDETPRTRAEVIAALGQTDLARWMRDYNHEASE
jgi:transcriptional regulator